MTAGELIAIILGSGGLAGAINLLVGRWLDASSKRRNSSYQALLVAEHLENYAFGCAGNAFTTWTVLVEGRPGGLLSSVPAFPPFSEKIEWPQLDPSLVSAARRLEGNSQVAHAQTVTAFGRSGASGFRFAFAETLRLGNEAWAAAAAIRNHYGLTLLTFEPPRWDWPTFLHGELEKLDLRRTQIDAHVGHEPSPSSAISLPAVAADEQPAQT